jgi:hypothetical protein
MRLQVHRRVRHRETRPLPLLHLLLPRPLRPLRLHRPPHRRRLPRHRAADALLDFYTRTDLITAAITAEQELRTDGYQQHAPELDAITGQITTTETAIDRYHAAFEHGTLDERTCGHRIRDLSAKLGQLTAAELT